MKQLKELLADQAYYAKTFLPTSEFFEKKGFYKKVAKFVNGGNIIIDVGCADCRLIRHLKEMDQEVSIIGIDINPLLLMAGNEILLRYSYKANMHIGANISIDPHTKKLTLISDIVTQKVPYKFEKGKINLLQEDFRFGEILRERLEKDLPLADVITYTLPGGFSPHMILEKGEKNYNSAQAGLEMNEHVLALGTELLRNKGRMILALRAGSQNPKESLSNINLDELNLSRFKPFYNINKIEIIYVDEQKENLKLSLPAYTIHNNTIHYSEDIKKMKHNFQIVILLIEMIKKCGI